MDILLLPSLWLDGSAWSEVVAELEALGHHPTTLTLPGHGDGSRTATLEDQLAVVVAAVDAASARPVVVGHGDAATLAWLAVDRRPSQVAAAVCIGYYPLAQGHYVTYADARGVMPFPGWDYYGDLERRGLDAATQRRIEDDAIPIPLSVGQSFVQFRDDRRFDVPITMVCAEITPAEARMDIDGGEAPELMRARYLRLIGLDSGSWPMFSKPVELARVIAGAAVD